ncbi:hypothetical protein ACGFZ9_51635, partial [Streptomyces mirabilis]|uniref:hypothetical protein n=1 Tax=Streptomyces mirabilis TaxID=68239 RepID=UPI00371D399D
ATQRPQREPPARPARAQVITKRTPADYAEALEYEVDGILDIIVSRLDDHPGHGWQLIETALNNRTSRNRRMALRALKGWPTEFLPPTARQILFAAAAREPVPELRSEIAQEAGRL